MVGVVAAATVLVVSEVDDAAGAKALAGLLGIFGGALATFTVADEEVLRTCVSEPALRLAARTTPVGGGAFDGGMPIGGGYSPDGFGEERGGVTWTSFTRRFDAKATDGTAARPPPPPPPPPPAEDLLPPADGLLVLTGEVLAGGEAQQIAEPPPTAP